MNMLNSPKLINTSTTNRRPQPPADRVVTNTLISKTLRSDTTTRAWQALQAKQVDPPNASPSFFLLLSLGPGLDGYNGNLHGGMLGIIIDQATSMCAIGAAGPTAATAEMTLRYKKRSPLPSMVLCRSVVTKWEGRKLWLRGTIEDGAGTVFCEADSVFVTRNEEKL
ncbi:hypothetical protein JMJ35_007128 [Cladonia borealis]|uniref:Thioesterase domain-containing protein n=1 Tax=Cladonia borealis TaxID=184061 RepID=A0AA39QZK1_9LECA|nr:hypothetical protein JMJ35_007128 [Cladonia borealis]